MHDLRINELNSCLNFVELLQLLIFLFHDNSQINLLFVFFRQNRSCLKQRMYMKRLIQNCTVNCQPYTAGA